MIKRRRTCGVSGRWGRRSKTTMMWLVKVARLTKAEAMEGGGAAGGEAPQPAALLLITREVPQ
jgi:hypothetical protein